MVEFYGCVVVKLKQTCRFLHHQANSHSEPKSCHHLYTVRDFVLQVVSKKVHHDTRMPAIFRHTCGRAVSSWPQANKNCGTSALSDWVSLLRHLPRAVGDVAEAVSFQPTRGMVYGPSGAFDLPLAGVYCEDAILSSSSINTY